MPASKGIRRAVVFLAYLALSWAMLAPLSYDLLPISPGDDAANHVAGVVEARNALREGQLPLRVAPRQDAGRRYPAFQLYGNLPYTLAGALSAIGLGDPYRCIKLTLALILALGGSAVHALARYLRRPEPAALLAGAAFLSGPYLLMDIHGRTAWTEVVGFALLPLAFGATLRAVARGRGQASAVAAAGLAWAALAHAHNIAFMYGAIFTSLFVASMLRPDAKSARRALRAASAFGIGVLLSAWYLAPQVQLMPDLRLQPQPARLGMWARVLTPLPALLAPTAVAPAPLPSPGPNQRFTLQVGWPFLAAALMAAGGAPGRRSGRWFQRRLLVAFAVSLVLVWTPFDFWPHLPRLLSYVQFPYRLLMFAALAGSLLVAFAIQAGRPAHVAGALLLLGANAAPYLGTHRVELQGSVEAERAEPRLGRFTGGANTAYQLSGLAIVRATAVAPELDLAASVVPEGRLSYPGELPLPLLRPGETVVVEGRVPPEQGEALMLAAALDGDGDGDEPAAQRVEPGPFRLVLPVSAPSSGPTSVLRLRSDRWLDPLDRPSVPGPGSWAVLLEHIWIEGPPRPGLLPTVRVPPRSASWKVGQVSTADVDLAAPSLVAMPVLWYPRLLDVRLDGRAVAYGNLGRELTVAVPAGRHRISVRFAGLPWANTLSTGALVGCLGALVLRRGSHRWEWSRAAWILGFALVPAAVLLFLVQPAGEPPRLRISASRWADEAHRPANVLDDDPETEWVAPGFLPARLTIEPDRAGALDWLSFRSARPETWRRIDARFLRGGRILADRTMRADGMARGPVVMVLDGLEADRIELTFSCPPATSPDRTPEPALAELALGWR